MKLKEIKYERRLTVPAAHLATRAVNDPATGKDYIEGYAVLFNTPSRLIAERGKVFNEIIQPTAFDRILANNPNVIMNVNHDDNQPLARTKNNSLTLTKNETGIKYRFEVPPTTLGQDTLSLVKSGFYQESSFRYSINEAGEEFKRDANGDLIHIVREASNLFDCSIVTDGCFPTNGITVSNRVMQRAMVLLESGDTIIQIQSEATGAADEPENQDTSIATGDTAIAGSDNDMDMVNAGIELTILKLKLC